jgi:ArsR family transcriptional regulator, arsenate/arsenite/antimonite-responsive transcriptional repressor
MKQSQALLSFAALSQDTRLEILRLLVRAGPEGMAAGAVAEEVGVSPSNLSFHLKELERAGLVSARREARSIFYSADYAALRGLIAFLTEDCCGGRREICGPVKGRGKAKAAVC